MTTSGRSTNIDRSVDLKIRGGDLSAFRPILEVLADKLSGIEPLPRVYLVLDADAVIRELRFRVRRRQPEAKSALGEIP